MCERGRDGGRGPGGGGGCGREKRKHHGNVIQTLLNLSKAFIFGQPQSATRTAVNKEKKLENCKRIITSGDKETERNAPMQATQICERGDDVVSWEISPRVHPYIFAFLFLVSSGSYHWKKAVRCLAGVHPQDDVLPLIRNLKLTLLSHRWSLQLFTTIRRHQQSAPALLLEKLSFHDHQHSTRGRQHGDFRPFQPASLAGRISFTNRSRAPLLWNMLPREVQTSSSMLVFKKNVSLLLDSPASGKNLLQICFGNTTI